MSGWAAWWSRDLFDKGNKYHKYSKYQLKTFFPLVFNLTEYFISRIVLVGLIFFFGGGGGGDGEGDSYGDGFLKYKCKSVILWKLCNC